MGKPLRIAGISGIILLVLTLVSIILPVSTFFGTFGSTKSGAEVFQQQIKVISYILYMIAFLPLIISPLSIGFFYGFVALGKRFNSKMLLITGWIFIVLAILGFILTFILTLGFSVTGNLSHEKQITQTGSSFENILKQRVSQIPLIGAILDIFGEIWFWPLLILFVAGLLSLKLVFAIGLIRLKKNGVPLADWSGWFEIGSIIASILGTLALIMETIMFFKASKKFEQENS